MIRPVSGLGFPCGSLRFRNLAEAGPDGRLRLSAFGRLKLRRLRSLREVAA